MKTTVAARLEDDVKKKVQQESVRKNRSVSWIINERLKQAYNKK